MLQTKKPTERPNILGGLGGWLWLAAIILPEFLSFEGHFSFSPTNDKLMAGIAATACYLLTKRMVGMIVVGMGVYTALRLLG